MVFNNMPSLPSALNNHILHDNSNLGPLCKLGSFNL
jgi:hypothetical protein